MNFADMLDYVTRGGSTAVLLLIIWAFYTDRIVTRRTHQRVIQERNEYKQEWADALRLAGRSANVADKVLKAAEDEHEHGSRLRAQRQVRGVTRASDDEDA